MADPNDLASMLEFFTIDDTDLETLSKLKRPLEDHADAMVNGFYQHLEKFPETRTMLEDPKVRQRLLEAQKNYLLSLAEPVIDEAYVAKRASIGMTHERIELDTRWYFGAYALYFGLLSPVVRDHFKDDAEARSQAINALAKRLILDAEIAIRQYIERREAELQKLNEQLRAEGRDLSREVATTHRDLLKTEARARQAEQLADVATLISGLAHEIGTPMGVIRGHAEALGSAVEGERATWRLNMILEQIDRITGIIQALLNMARPRESLRTNVDLVESIESTLGFLTEKIKRRKVQLIKELAPVIASNADPEKLQQVFLNLLINAIDSMPNGGDLTISVELDDEIAVIRVRDTGSGIAANQVNSIFEPFYTTKQAGRGNGLGLVVVSGIVDEHGGTIEVQSELDQGTEFTLRLPAAAAQP